MKITIQIGSDNVVHSQISCEGENFVRARECIKLAAAELQQNLDSQKTCPMHPANKISVKNEIPENFT